MGNKDKGNFWIGIGLVCVVLGATQIANPSSSHPTGRWSFILGPLFDAFGQVGPPMFSIVLGISFVVLGFSLRSKK